MGILQLLRDPEGAEIAAIVSKQFFGCTRADIISDKLVDNAPHIKEAIEKTEKAIEFGLTRETADLNKLFKETENLSRISGLGSIGHKGINQMLESVHSGIAALTSHEVFPDEFTDRVQLRTNEIRLKAADAINQANLDLIDTLENSEYYDTIQITADIAKQRDEISEGAHKIISDYAKAGLDVESAKQEVKRSQLEKQMANFEKEIIDMYREEVLVDFSIANEMKRDIEVKRSTVLNPMQNRNIAALNEKKEQLESATAVYKKFCNTPAIEGVDHYPTAFKNLFKKVQSIAASAQRNSIEMTQNVAKEQRKQEVLS